MKIIDLLNKISNGEKAPKKIKYENEYYNLIKKYNNDWQEYEFGYQLDGGGYLNIWRFDVLNDEVEIIEEKKIPDKLDLQYKDISKGIKFEEEILMYCDNLQYKINEIIDYLKSKGE